MPKEKNTHRIQINIDNLSDIKLIELIDYFSLQEIDFDYIELGYIEDKYNPNQTYKFIYPYEDTGISSI